MPQSFWSIDPLPALAQSRATVVDLALLTGHQTVREVYFQLRDGPRHCFVDPRQLPSLRRRKLNRLPPQLLQSSRGSGLLHRRDQVVQEV